MEDNIVDKYKGLGFAFETFMEKELGEDIFPDDPTMPILLKEKEKERSELPAIKVSPNEKIVFINWLEMYKRLPDVKIDKNNIGTKEMLEQAFLGTDVIEIINWFELIVEDHNWFESSVENIKTKNKKWEIRFYNYPEKKRITELNSDDRNLLVSIKGVPVFRGKEIYAQPEKIKWICGDCRTATIQFVKRGEKIKKFNKKCTNLIGDSSRPEKQFMCRSTNWVGGDIETYKNLFSVQIESTLDETPNKIEPPIFSLEFAGNICSETFLSQIHLGSAYKFTGIIKMREKYDKQKVRIDVPYMEVMAFEEIEKKKFDLNISKEEESQIKNFLKKSDSLQIATEMFGNRVIGYTREKKFFILTKLMQERFNKVNAHPKNYLLHLLVVGNYSRGKSELAEIFQEICENPYYIIGSATTGVGLTGITLRDEVTGTWGIQAGILARASGDTLIVEEFDKTRDKTEFGVLNEAMSKFEYRVTKAGEHRTFKSNTQVVVIANPENKIFDETSSLIPQINITGDLLSRFSAISCVLSPKDIEKEIEINKIMIQRSSDELYKKDQENALFLKKCLKIASEQEPKIDVPEVEQYVNNFTRQAFILSQQTYGIDKDFYSNITPRHRMTLIKLIKGVAMWHLHSIPTREDMDEAFSLISKFWKEFIERPKLLNMREIEFGMSMAEIQETAEQKIATDKWEVVVEEKIESKKDKIDFLVEYITKESHESENKMTDIENVKQYAIEKLEFTGRKFDDMIEKLKKEGDIYEPKAGFISPIT